VAIYSVEADTLERQFTVGEPVTDSVWAESKVFISTAKGSVKVLERGVEVASFTDHAGPATGIALHPSLSILASIGADKSFVFYDLKKLQRATRVYTNAGKFCSHGGSCLSGVLLHG
jgi:pre-mRNA-processing factor 19